MGSAKFFPGPLGQRHDVHPTSELRQISSQGGNQCGAQKEIRDRPGLAAELGKEQIVKQGGGGECRQVSDDDIVPREPEKLAEHRDDLGPDAKDGQRRQNLPAGSRVHPGGRIFRLGG